MAPVELIKMTKLASAHSKSTSKSATKENSSRSRGRPRKEETDYLSEFKRVGAKTLKAEVLWNCIIRRLLRKIEKRLSRKDLNDKKLAQLKPYLKEIDELIDTNREPLNYTLTKWFLELDRKPEHKNRQYNQVEIKSLLMSSPLVLTIFMTFVESLLTCPVSIKCEVMNIRVWPKQGDQRVRTIMLQGDIIEQAMKGINCIESVDVPTIEANDEAHPIENGAPNFLGDSSTLDNRDSMFLIGKHNFVDAQSLFYGSASDALENLAEDPVLIMERHVESMRLDDYLS